jgi:hypothetical protein
LRAGFVTFAHLRGASDRAIAAPDPAPLPGHPRRVCARRDGVAGQRRHPTRAVSDVRLLRGPAVDGGTGPLLPAR